MGGLSRFHDGGAFCKAINLGVNNALTAASTGDNTLVTSAYVDVRGYQSAKLVITALSSITAAKLLNMTAGLSDATDTSGTGAAAFGTGVTTKQVDAGAVTAHLSQLVLDYNLAGCRGYIASTVTPDLTNSATDTSNFSVTLLLFGAGEEPVSDRAN
ncbi:MAG TPA: hypothetical protein DEQ40_14410 [Oxalobacteraceae bacterium]|jgi:hypothetical protein|nr:hypothetical protein [Oxalobacteraceae bacterium]